MLANVLNSELMNEYIFRKEVDVSSIIDNEGQTEVILFAQNHEKGHVLEIDIKNNDLNLSTDKNLRFVIIMEYTDQGHKNVVFYNDDPDSRTMSATIYSQKEVDQKVTVICFRNDSPDRLLSEARNLETDSETILTLTYTKSQWQKDQEANQESQLSTGVIIGITVGAGGLVILLIVLIVCCVKKRGRKVNHPKKQKSKTTKSTNESINTTLQVNNTFNSHQKYLFVLLFNFEAKQP